MRTFIVFIVFVATTILSGCNSNNQKAAELLDTALFEEKQNNFEHAATLYDEILKKHPESQSAKSAAERLTALKQRKP